MANGSDNIAITGWKNYALSGGWTGASEITDEGIEDRGEKERFSCRVDRKALKQIIKRTDGPALRHFGF